MFQVLGRGQCQRAMSKSPPESSLHSTEQSSPRPCVCAPSTDMLIRLRTEIRRSPHCFLAAFLKYQKSFDIRTPCTVQWLDSEGGKRRWKGDLVSKIFPQICVVYAPDSWVIRRPHLSVCHRFCSSKPPGIRFHGSPEIAGLETDESARLENDVLENDLFLRHTCGHSRFCTTCAEVVAQMDSGCPICRCPIQMILRVFN